MSNNVESAIADTGADLSEMFIEHYVNLKNSLPLFLKEFLGYLIFNNPSNKERLFVYSGNINFRS